MPTAIRRIKSAKITTLALCKRAKNQFRTLLKSDGAVELTFLTKGKPTVEGEVLAVVYAPEKPDFDGDAADAEVIKAFAYQYQRDHRQLDIEHDGQPLSAEDAFVAESFIVAKGDERFKDWRDYDDKPVGDLTGAWAVVLKLENQALRDAWSGGELDGISMFGRAAVEHVDIKAASQRVAASMGGRENSMTNAEFEALLAAQTAKMSELVKSEVAAALKGKEAPAPAKEEPKDEAPTFTGDPFNPEELAEYEKQLQRYEMTKALKSGKMSAKDIAEMRKGLTETAPSVEELNAAGIKADESDSAAVRKLQVDLFKARKGGSAVPERKGAGLSAEDELRKANQSEGLAIAALVNQRQGVGAAGMKIVPA